MLRHISQRAPVPQPITAEELPDSPRKDALYLVALHGIQNAMEQCVIKMRTSPYWTQVYDILKTVKC